MLRSVPVIRHHSWHLAKLTEAPCTTGTGDPSDGPPAMQLHFTPLSVPWHSGGDNSELSMQWGHISRHYSTDRSSSIGSMESLENPPNQGYYDSQLSPIDPVIFNNKRDSAYSSFSASSNTSDYTVSVKPEETNSMDSLLQGLGSSCRYPDRSQHSAPTGHGNQQEEQEHSKVLPGRTEAKVRPSSYSCEEENCAPPHPPIRRESFRATRGQATDKRCVSAPVGIPNVSSCTVEDQSQIEDVLTGRVYLNGIDSEPDRKGCSIQPYYTLNSDSGGDGKAIDHEKEHLENYSKSVAAASSPPLSTLSQRNRDENFDTQLRPEHDLQSTMNRHSAPEKLLAAQLCMMDVSADKSDHCASPTCQWSQSPLYLSDSGQNAEQSKWGTSRCSTPGSVATSEVEDPRLEEESLDGQNPWGHPISLSGNAMGNGFSQSNENNGGEVRLDDGLGSKQTQKRQFRCSKSRRRSERFATNLRNEIQRKKAQLQKSRNPCGEETVEEEVGDFNTEAVAPPEYHQHRPQILPKPPTSAVPIQISKPAPQKAFDPKQTEEYSSGRVVCFQTSQTQTQIPQHVRQVYVHVVEEVAPAGKPRRWRWTPERKLELENEPSESKRNETIGQMWSGKMGSTRGRTSSSSGRLGRSDDCDILPFADRRRFFEETSRKLSQSVTNLSNLTSRSQRLDKPCRTNHPSSPEPHEIAAHLGRRRFSYQDVPYVNSLDNGRQFMSNQQDQEKMRQRLIEREHEKEREQERFKEQEKLREQDREKERLRKERENEQQRLKDWEERQRLLQREQEWESVRETVCSEHNTSNDTVPHSLSHDVYRKQPPSPQIPSSLQLSEPFYSSTTTNIQKPCSAFHPVTTQHNRYHGYQVNPPYKPRNYTPDEAQYVQEQEKTRKINRNFSLTERDYPRCRRDSKTVDGANVPGVVRAGGNSITGGRNEEHLFTPLRNRAMSENNLCVETQHFQNHSSSSGVSRMRSSTLSDLDENAVSVGEVKKKKGPPPPRPPPPKWDQFHKRRASHHSLFSSTLHYSSPSASPPLPQPQTCTSRPPSVSEMSRQRSYSLPPRDMSESLHCCSQEYSVAPSSPAFTRRAFKPVALPPRERDYDTRREVHQPVPQPEPCTRIPVHPATASEEPRVTHLKPTFPDHEVEWDRSSPHYPTQGKTRTPEVPSNKFLGGPLCPESYFSMNNFQLQPQQAGFPITAHKTQIIPSQGPEDGDLPLETDIDEICENEQAERKETEDRMEMQGFARPVMVLETDIDHTPEEAAPSARSIRGPRGSLVDSILDDEYGVSRKELIGELFPHSVNAEMSGDGWRGGYPISGGTLERASRLNTSTAPQVSRSTCYDMSADNPQLLAKFREISERKEEDEELNYKKQLMESLRKKLTVLREAQRGLQEDIRANAQLGEEVESLVLAICKPNEVDKYRMFIGDLDKVTSLLLSLSGRLIRVESALDCVDPETGHQERLQLLEKKKQLLVQMGEAQELKEHVDRREQAVCRVLGCCLTPEQMRDYGHFVKMKAALLVEQRQLDDKIRLGEEQLRGLRESLNLGFGMGYGHY